jgi:predicted nucleotidyltransferase
MNNKDDMMNDANIKKRLYNQTPLRILSFLSVNPGEIFSAQEISKQARSSKGSTSQTLRLFLGLGILSRQKKGNLFLYKLNAGSNIVRQFKVFENLLSIHKLIEQIQPYCYKIALFGSCADGTNSADSDIDLFIKSEYKDKVRRIINNYKGIESKIQAVVQDPLEIASSEKEDKPFLQQVKKGIILWEGKPSYE